MVTIYIFIVIILILNLDILFPKIFRCKLVLKIKRSKLKYKTFMAFAWALLMILWTGSFVSDINRHKENNLYTINKFSIYWIVLCFFQVVRGFKTVEIREKGIFVHDGFFYKFKNISFYTLKSPNILRITYKNLFKNDKDYELKFRDEEEALRFDEALQKYVKKL